MTNRWFWVVERRGKKPWHWEPVAAWYTRDNARECIKEWREKYPNDTFKLMRYEPNYQDVR